MAKTAELHEVAVTKLRPYERNAKIHSPEQVEKIAESIKAFGFLSPVLIDREFNIIAGHGRVMAAQKIGMTEIPCVFVEGLTPEQRRAYILADNRLAELAEWDMHAVYSELGALDDLGFDVDYTGFEMPQNADWFDRSERDYDDTEGESDEYSDFVDKFKPKKTTDDCYTPDEIYAAVCEWAKNEYGITKPICRPFYPGGDYVSEDYAGKVVLDNPPFSILAEIVKFYNENGVEYFLFCPGLTPFSSVRDTCCIIAVGVEIVYENGASVGTSFVTNLEGAGVRTAPDLYKTVTEENKRRLREMHADLPKYSYPDEVITAAGCNYLSKYGVEMKIDACNLYHIRELDSQKEHGKAIYGSGFLISEKVAAEKVAAEKVAAEKAAAEKVAAEKAAAEKAAATRWMLSEREREIIRGLGNG